MIETVHDGDELLPLIGLQAQPGRTLQALRRRRAELIDLFFDYVAQFDLEDVMSALSLDGVDRIARAALFASLHASDLTSEERKAMLRGWIVAERLRVTVTARPQPYWTALGDVFLSGDPAGDFIAPSAAGVVIDARGPLAQSLPFLPEALRAGTILVTQLQNAAVALQGALDLVHAIDPATFGFVTAALTSIVIYENPQRTTSFSSSSSRSFPGAAMISNVLGNHVDRYRLADALVHEAVHSYLYAVEAHAPLVYPDCRFEPRITSPWTSAELPLHAFTHACFVWLSLSRFWSTAAARHGLNEASVEHYRARALSGFSEQRLEEAISRLETAIPEAAFSALGQVREAARRHF
jgi:hypothetical protein